MAAIIPRWEWRTFGTRFGAAEDHFAGLSPGGIQESDELYLLSGAGDNVKVRDDLMDIKVFVEADADGLEQWRPVMKAGFPLAAADVARVFEALRLAPPRACPGGLHPRPVRGGARRARRRDARRHGPQAARPVRRGRLHRRGLRGRGGRAADPHDRHRVRGRGRGHRGRPLGGPGRIRQHELPEGPRQRSSTARRRAMRSSTSARTRSSSTSASATPAGRGTRSSTAPS